MGHQKRKKLTNRKASKIAKNLEADIYIMGSFLALKDKIQINGRIYNTEDGSGLGGAKVSGELSSQIFQTLDTFAQKLAESLDKNVPHDRIIERTIVKERVIYRGGTKWSGFALALGPNMVMPSGFLASVFDFGFGADFKATYTGLLTPNLTIGLHSGYHELTPLGTDAHKFSLTPVRALIGYNFNISRGTFVLMPYASGGLDIGAYEGKNSAINYRNASIGGGLTFAYFLTRTFAIHLDGSYGAQFDLELSSFINANLGVTLRL